MTDNNNALKKLLPNTQADAVLRLGAIVFLIVMCARVIHPFVNLALWSIVLAIALYPLHKAVTARVGGRSGRAASILVVAGLLLIGAPTVMLGISFAQEVNENYVAFEAGTLTVPQPKASVADWPVVGERLYSAWSAAATNLPQFVMENKEGLTKLAQRGLTAAANTAGSMLLFLASLVVAGIIMAYGESGSQAMQRIFSRFAGEDRGPKLQFLTTSTVRSVATGVIGVAFIQALILGVGFLWAGIPAAGVLAMIVMVVGIVQAPALLVTIPVIAYLWTSGDASNTMNILYTIYLFVGGLADNVLKPLLLGRGVDAPMPVILLGALGGMVTGGIVGLFIGAVFLAVGYQLFMEWVDMGSQTVDEDDATAETVTQP
ncbi:MAG: AI-2E family transporter [Pseudomonadota bacterium]